MSMAPGSRSMNARWDADPSGYDAVRQCHLNNRRTAFISQVLADARPGDHVLDIGAGTGWLVRRLATLRPDLVFTGVDPLESYVEFAAAAADEQGVGGRVRFVHGTAERLEDVVAPGEAPRWVLSNDVLHHVADVPATVRAATAIAAPSARWLIIEPNPVNPYVYTMHTLKRGEAVFHARRFLAVASSAGWSLRRRTSLFLVPPFVRRPPAWAARLEARFEHVRPLAGGVALELSRSG